TTELERLFTRDAAEAYRFFSRQVDADQLKQLRGYRRVLRHARLLFLAFTLKLTPARRAMYGVAVVSAVLGLVELTQGVHWWVGPHPVFATGTLSLLAGFLMMNLLVILELAGRLSLKNDLQIAAR